jgi:dihydroflavonol-4-reductase
VPKTPCVYVVSKSEAEQVVREMLGSTDLDAVIIHPGFMLAPNDWKPSSGRMMLEVCKAPLVLAPSGGCSVCDARDVAAATVNAIEAGQRGHNYILAGENMSYQELFSSMLETCGQRRRAGRLGPWIGLVARAIDAAHRWLPLPEGDINGASLAMGSLNHYYSSARAERELGYKRRPLDETLRDTWSWLAQRKSG